MNIYHDRYTGVMRRRNSLLHFVGDAGGSRRVYKQYLATYHITEEAAAYHKVAHLTARIPGVRPARVLEVNAELNRMTLEFVEGDNVRQRLLLHPLSRSAEQRIVNLLVATFRYQIHFDADPSNLILSEAELVIVDPLMQDFALRHLSAIIFFQGLCRLIIVTLHRPAAMKRTWSLLRRSMGGYFAGSTSGPRTLYSEWARYVTVVMRWNLTPWPGESFRIRTARRTLMVPAYGLQYVTLRFLALLSRIR